MVSIGPVYTDPCKGIFFGLQVAQEEVISLPPSPGSLHTVD